MQRRTMLIAGAVLTTTVVAAAVVWTRLPQQDPDPAYVPRTRARAFSPDTGPRVAIDEAHVNLHTANGRYAPFARLARADGFRVAPLSDRFAAAALADVDILVVANALGLAGAAEQLGTVLGLDRYARWTGSAFRDDEIESVAAWVASGGSLLLVADHRPAGAAAGRLARRFAVEMTNGYVEDPDHHDPVTGLPTTLVFDRADNLLGEHPILTGRRDDERVDRIVTFTGQALRAPAHATALLRLSGTAIERTGRGGDAPARSVAGLAQGVALTHGRGRVVVIGEAAFVTSQVVRGPDGPASIGLGWPGAHNERFALNVLRWLARVEG
ncbi:MAG: hypothetical protein AB1635_11020 [Acidobacteriota bacterium]